MSQEKGIFLSEGKGDGKQTKNDKGIQRLVYHQS